MIHIEITEAGTNEFRDVSVQVTKLLLELEPEASKEIEEMDLPSITLKLLESSKIYAFLAKHNDITVGVITLHECAAIYAGGVFGEISELYVNPGYRSSNVGKLLVDSAIKKAKEFGWSRLEVGTPPSEKWPRTLRFYERYGFKGTGTRMRLLVA